MHKVFIQAQAVRVGDTLAFAAPHPHFFVERVSLQGGKVCLHALNDTHKFLYLPTDRVRVLRGEDRATAGDETAAIEADLAIAKAKQSGQWDRIRFAEANQRDFQEQFSRANTLGLWA